MSLIKKIINKIKSVHFIHLKPTEKAKYMKSKCHHMGDNVKIFTTSLGTEPYLVSIYDNVNIASGVNFVTHDISVFNVSKYLGMPEGKHLDKVGTITLCDNCCIGAYSTLMPNCYVGINSVIAANSVVLGKIPDNEVWGGVPAKFIMTIDEYADKLKQRNSSYPWINEGIFMVPQGSKELIRMREEFFFRDNEE